MKKINKINHTKTAFNGEGQVARYLEIKQNEQNEKFTVPDDSQWLYNTESGIK